MRSEARRSCGPARAPVWRRLRPVDDRVLDAQPLFVPGYRAECVEGRLDANQLVGRREAAHGKLGGLFYFWRAIIGTGSHFSSPSGERAFERANGQRPLG